MGDNQNARKLLFTDLENTKTSYNRIENPNWQEATSWLFTSVIEDLTWKSRLPFAPIGPIYQKRPRKPETGIKDGFEQNWNTNFRSVHSDRETGLPVQTCHCLRRFST